MSSFNDLILACKRANHVLFITGAGISAASGLPTYRGENGLYSKSVIPPEWIMNGLIMKWFPGLIWKRFYKLYSKEIKPNVAHESIALMELFIDRVSIITQNVDGLHHKAGSSEIVELHGRAYELKCTHCKFIDKSPNLSNIKEIPKCICGGILRPNVVLFGEELIESETNKYFNIISSNPDVVIMVGTSANFSYVNWPIYNGIKNGAITAIINPNKPEIVPHIWIKEKAEDALPYLAGQIGACQEDFF